MRAAILEGREDLQIREIAPPALRPGEIRVGIEAALTCGTDLKVFKRGYHARMIVPPSPFGHEWAGTIAELGPGVTGWRVGERVTGANSAPCGVCGYCTRGEENLCDDLLFLNGAYAESIVVPARLVATNLLRLKPGTPFAAAALTEPLACVVKGAEDAGLQSGQRVLVIGSGPIGLLFVRLARHLGCQVTVAGRGESRLATARRLGASQVCDVGSQDDPTTAVQSAVVGGFDVVLEAVGRRETWEAAVRLVRKGGTVNFFGGCPAGTNVTFDAGLIHYSNLTLVASFHHTPRAIRKSLELVESGAVDARDFVDGRCSLGDLPQWFRSMAEGNRFVKTLISVRE